MREKIEAAFDDRTLLEDEEYSAAVFDAIAALDRGELRVAQREGGEWQLERLGDEGDLRCTSSSPGWRS